MELSTRYEPQATEAKWYPLWNDAGCFGADANSSRPPYCIVIPPPNITGILHMGHALNNTLQDALIRWRRMAGDNALWVPGTDHAGIATQNVVERSLLAQGSSRHSLGREAFLEQVWQWRDKHGDIIVNQLKRMGCSCDWTRERFTLDEGLTRAVRTTFSRLYRDGLIYRGNYLVNWCVRCGTTLADDEVEYTDKQGKLWHMRYPIEGLPGEFAVVATTRPETMLGDTAVAVNPADDRYKHLIGRHVLLPLVNRRIPIIADDFVDREFGTGMVKITPAHDPNDYQAGKRHGLEEINVLTPDGHINENGAAFEGLERYAARKAVVAELEKLGLMEKIESHPQRVGECYRCHTAVEPYISLQWFVKMAPLAAPARKAVEDGRVHFHPEGRVNDYYRWLDGLRDWAISRQLWWGHQIPAFYDDEGNVHVPDTDEEYEQMRADARDGKLRQDPDVLDTWFSSALWPFSTLGWPDEQSADLKAFYPTSVLITAKDIIFFWVARMIMMGLHLRDEVPFHDVYFNPIVADEHGKKMSKSKGNAIDPLTLMEEYGTDALRFTLCAYASRDQHIAFNVKECEGYRNFMNKLWNASRFIFSNLEGLTAEDLAAAAPADPAARAAMPLEDRWILSRYAHTVQAVNEALTGFDFDIAVKAIYDFFWKDFCDYHIELTKSRLYGATNDPSPEATARSKSAQAMLVVILEGTLRLLHPVCPFITEEIWNALRDTLPQGFAQEAPTGQTLGAESAKAFSSTFLMTAPWPTFDPQSYIDEAAETQLELLQEVIYTIRNIRGEMKMGPGIAATIRMAAPDQPTLEALRRDTAFFHALTNLKTLEMDMEGAVSSPAFAATGMARGVMIYVELPEEMKQQECQRLEKEVARLAGEVTRLGAKLSNESFTAKAPAAVVEKEREKLFTLQEEHDTITKKLALLGND
ncbi:valine--tRNA ligase [candidate division BRC1 bacterium HGW-BRC1-1]|jgi:valyl-tRNA synthetase|nr:MAG: valine--tRNA ligase [candidate division BRC1 bacterium HGW-BRC1-1]